MQPLEFDPAGDPSMLQVSIATLAVDIFVVVAWAAIIFAVVRLMWFFITEWRG